MGSAIAPAHTMVDAGTNPEPVTAIVNPFPYGAALSGDSFWMDGIGFSDAPFEIDAKKIRTRRRGRIRIGRS